MNSKQSLGLLLLLVVSTAFPVLAQPSASERQHFDSIRAKADKGDADAQLALAFCYANGTGVNPDPGKAFKWLRKAAEQGQAKAQCLLGLRYSSGDGVKPDKLEAVRWLRRSADQGLPEAQYDLGMCYANGEGIRPNIQEAAAWYRKAAEQGLPDAQCELGNCFLEGTGVPRDLPEGVAWTRKAAEQGFARAQNILGLCYLKGTGLAKDPVQAYKWFNLAAAAGGPLTDDAKVNLAAAQRYLSPEQVAEAQRLASEFKPQKEPLDKAASTSTGTNSAPVRLTGSGAGTNSPGISTGAAEPTGTVTVKAEDDSYEIYADGAFVRNTPAKIKLAAGAHLIEVKRTGYQDYQRQIQVSGGSELTLRATLERK